MNRPLETTFWMRFSRFLKGVFLYNTIYWKRASDDLNIRHMSREERATLRPKRDLDIIRPRENPRPTSAATALSQPPEVSDPVRSELAAAPPPQAVESAPRAMAQEDETVEIHRRRKRRRSRHSKVMPKQFYDPDQEPSGKILGWLFKK